MQMNRSVVLVNQRLKTSQVIFEDGIVGAVSCLAISEVEPGSSLCEVVC